MADTTYVKGELLFEESITTSNSGDFSSAYCQTKMFLNQDVLIIEFDDTEYTCEAIKIDGWPNCYGGMSLQGPDFSVFPFAINNITNAGVPQSTIWFATKNPGTYSLKVYTTAEDSDSDSDTSNESITIHSYITKNLTNLNWNILPQIFEENGVELTEEIEAYLRNTPENTNWNVLNGMSGSGNSDTLPKKLIITRGNGNSYNFTENSDFQSFEDLQTFIDKYKFKEDEFSYYHMPSNTITLINVMNGVDYPAPDNPTSQNGTYWVWHESGDMEWRVDLINQTIGYYSYDD